MFLAMGVLAGSGDRYPQRSPPIAFEAAATARRRARGGRGRAVDAAVCEGAGIEFDLHNVLLLSITKLNRDKVSL